MPVPMISTMISNGFLTAYTIEMVAIFVLHKMTHVKFELTDNKQ